MRTRPLNPPGRLVFRAVTDLLIVVRQPDPTRTPQRATARDAPRSTQTLESSRAGGLACLREVVAALGKQHERTLRLNALTLRTRRRHRLQRAHGRTGALMIRATRAACAHVRTVRPREGGQRWRAHARTVPPRKAGDHGVGQGEVLWFADGPQESHTFQPGFSAKREKYDSCISALSPMVSLNGGICDIFGCPRKGLPGVREKTIFLQSGPKTGNAGTPLPRQCVPVRQGGLKPAPKVRGRIRVRTSQYPPRARTRIPRVGATCRLSRLQC